MFPEHQSSYTSIAADRSQAGVAKKFVANVFLWMFGALAISALFAWLFASNQELMHYLVVQTSMGKKSLTLFGNVVMWAPLLFVFGMSFGYQRLSATLMAALFIAYAAIMGISLSFVLLVYTSGSVISCFAAAAVMFGIMAVMGYTTDKDLTSFGRIMMMGLIGILIASLINWWAGSAQLDWIISIVGVAVFTGLTAYDVQRIKRIGMGLEADETGGTAVAEGARKASVFGALTLYLDFINLFLMILNLFGDRRR